MVIKRGTSRFTRKFKLGWRGKISYRDKDHKHFDLRRAIKIKIFSIVKLHIDEKIIDLETKGWGWEVERNSELHHLIMLILIF